MPFADHLRGWRRRRGLSQLSLGLTADVSARHIAFLETGRSHPTRAMVLRLSEALAVPRADRNAWLEAAGFAAAYRRRDLRTAEMATIRSAVDWMLERHAPYPAFAYDRHWSLAALNPPAAALLGAVGLGAGDNMLQALLKPGPLRQAIDNWPEVALHVGARLRTESRHVGGDPVLDEAAAMLAAERDEPGVGPGVLPAVTTTRYRLGDVLLTMFSTIAQFGSAEDIALAELKLELLFPADEATRQALLAAAAGT